MHRIVLFVLLMSCFGCAASKQLVRVQVMDTPAKPNNETVTASYEIELK